MDTNKDPNNLGVTEPKNDQAKSDNVAKPNNQSEVSINFTPKIPTLDQKKPSTEAPKTDVVSLQLDKKDPKAVGSTHVKETPKPKETATKKKGFLSGLLGKRSSSKMVTTPSSAWGDAVDVPKDLRTDEKKPAPATLKLGAEKKPSPAPEKTAVPTVIKPKLATKNPPNDNHNETEDFFESSALEEKSGTSKLVENIATQKAQLEQPKVEDLLGKKSTILEKSIEQESLLRKKKKLRVTQFLALFLAVLTITVNGYLYYQLSPGLNLFGFIDYTFESNLRNDLFNLNQSLRAQQTELNKYRFLSGQLYLNQFGYESTRFIDGIADLELPSSNTEKAKTQEVVNQAKEEMPVLLAGAQKNLTAPITVDSYPTRGEERLEQNMLESSFQRDLRVAIGKEKSALKAATDQSGLPSSNRELLIFDNAIKLVGSKKLTDNLNSITVDAFKTESDEYEQNADPAQRARFRTFINNLLASTKVNLATITHLRNSRIRWSDVIDRLETITNQVNSEHNSGLGANNASKFTYSSYNFNTESGTISISASNTTRSGTNREVVTYLIEALEASPEFKNVSSRNFPLSKTKDANGQATFTLNFKIDMEVEDGAFSKMNSPVADLQAGQKVAVLRVPVRRKQ